MGIMEKVMKIFKRSKEHEEEFEAEEVGDADEIIKKAVEVSKKGTDIYDDDPWKEFKVLCKDVGADVTEVTHKLAWDYIEETGGIETDPITIAKEYIDSINEIDEVISKVSEPSSVKKLRKYREALTEVKEFKRVIEDLNTKRITPSDVLPILMKLANRGEE